MNRKKKIFIILPLIAVALVCAVVLIITNLSKADLDSKDSLLNNNSQSTSQAFLLEQYPIKTVPLYKMTKVESSKFYYNSDSGNTSAFNESPYSYFNVVYKTTASKDEVFSYYRKIFNKEIKEEFSNPESIKGAIDEYNIEINQYSDDTVYLQVYINKNKSDDIKKDLFAYFPMVDINLSYVKVDEKSYGLLNQKGGESEYTHYYTVTDTGDQNGDKIDDIDEFAKIQSVIQEKYKNSTDFNFENNVFEWTSDKNEKYTVEMSPDHERVYVQIRKQV